MKFKIIFTFCLIGFSVSAMADAELNENEQQLEELTKTELSTTPKNVETQTASRYAQSRSAAPSSLRVVTAEDIRHYGFRTLGEALRSLPGVYLNDDRGYSYLGVRGFNSPGDYNSRVLLLIDGERMNTDVYESIGIGQNDLVDIDLIERVEFSPGPGSALYGNSAFFGVINIITKKGHQIGGAQLSGEYGGLNTYKGRGAYGGRRENGDEFLVSATGFDRGGYGTLHYGAYDTPENNYGNVNNQDFESVQSAFGKFSHGAFKLQGGVNNRDKGLPAAPYGAQFNNPANDLVDQNAYAALNYDDTFGKNWTLHGGLSFHRHLYRGHYVYDIPQPTVNIDQGVGEWWRGELRGINTSYDHHRLMFGGEIQDNYLQNQSNVYANGQYPWSFPYSSVRYGFFGQDEWALTNKLSLHAGVRYDYNPLGGGSTNPRLSLIWEALENTSVKLMYGTAFRSPNALERYFLLTGYKANPNLKPETIQTTELAIEHFFTPANRLTASFYRYDLFNRIVQTTDNSGLLYFNNQGGAQGMGSEFTFEQRFQNGMRGMLSYSLQHAVDGQGNTLYNSPDHMIKLHMSTPVWRDNWRFNLETLYVSPRAAKTGYVNDYILNNLTLSGDPFKNTQLSFTIYNLFNYQYSDPVGGDFLQNAIMQDGRNFRLKLTIGF